MLLIIGATGSTTTTLNWDTSSVTKMNYMFSDAAAFNANISSWDTGNVTDIKICFGKHMFLIMVHLLGYQQL